MSRERGQGTVAVLGIIGALVASSVGALDLARAVHAAHVARAAADLAALAGAGPGVRGGAGPACSQAARFAALNHAQLATCAVQADGSVQVTVIATSGGPLPRTARASARAGPG